MPGKGIDMDGSENPTHAPVDWNRHVAYGGVVDPLWQALTPQTRKADDSAGATSAAPSGRESGIDG